MESYNMNSCSFRWLCGLLVLALIHDVSCDSNSECLTNIGGKTRIKADCQKGIFIEKKHLDKSFSFQVKSEDCQKGEEDIDGKKRSASIQFGQVCTVQVIVKTISDNYDVYINKKSVKKSASSSKIGCAPDWKKDDNGNEYLNFTGDTNECDLYMEFDHVFQAFDPYFSTTSTTTTSTTTTTLSTPDPSHPAGAPAFSTPVSFIGRNWPWIILGIVIIIVALFVLIGLIVWAKRRYARGEVPVEEGQTEMDQKQLSAKSNVTAKEIDDEKWVPCTYAPDNPELPTDPKNLDVGAGYENLEELQNELYFTPQQNVGKGNENRKELVGQTPDFGKGAGPESKKNKKQEVSETESESSDE